MKINWRMVFVGLLLVSCGCDKEPRIEKTVGKNAVDTRNYLLAHLIAIS